MQSKTKVTYPEKIKVQEVNELKEIREVLEKLLYVPTHYERLRPKIIEEIILYLSSRPEYNKYILQDPSEKDYKSKSFIAYYNGEMVGYISSEVRPDYISNTFHCGTFGWPQMINNFDVCKKLINECENFAKSCRINNKRIKKIRGPINWPKSMGGLGFQTKGFNERPLYGVAFSDPDSQVRDYLKTLGYQDDSWYSCGEVTSTVWDQGKKAHKKFKIKYKSLEEIINMKEEIQDLAANSFHKILPDTAGGEYRFKDLVNCYSQIPMTLYGMNDGFNPETDLNRPEYRETYNECDFNRAIIFAILVYTRYEDKFVGGIFCLPDLFELELDGKISRANVDTVMMRKEFSNQGGFSLANNFGQKFCNLKGVTYKEGTGIFKDNTRAVKTIFPHLKLIREHVVMQKRLK